jgi:hypothetical protein
MQCTCNSAQRTEEFHKRIVFTFCDLVDHFPLDFVSYTVHATTFEEYRDVVATFRREVNEWSLHRFDVPVAITEVIHNIPRNDEH